MKLQNVKLLSAADLKAMSLHDYQRAIIPAKVRDVMLSMKKHGAWKSHPIVWFRHKGKMMILWGHHRREAAVTLGIGAWTQEASDMTMEESIPLIQDENWATWKVLETVNREVRLGNPEYITLKKYVDHGMSVAAASSVLSGESANSSNYLKHVKRGTFKVQTTQHADTLVQVIDSFPDNLIVRNINFIKALSRCLFVPEFDPRVLIRKIKSNPGLLENRSTIKEFSAIIEKAYNYHTVKQIPLSFLADKVAKERMAIKSTAA